MIPTRMTDGSAGLDCYAAESKRLQPGTVTKVRLGFKLDQMRPEDLIGEYHGYELTIRGRSSMAARGIWAHTGTIDADYRGELGAILYNTNPFETQIRKGDRIAQLIVSPIIGVNLLRVTEVGTTDRGEGGFGSTGR